MSDLEHKQAVEAGLAKVTDQVKEWGEKAVAEAAKSGELSKKTREAVDEHLIKFQSLDPVHGGQP